MATDGERTEARDKTHKDNSSFKCKGYADCGKKKMEQSRCCGAFKMFVFSFLLWQKRIECGQYSCAKYIIVIINAKILDL